MAKSFIIVPSEEARDIVGGDHEDFETISDKITDKRRWLDIHTFVGKRLSDGLFFSVAYCEGSTEEQDERPFEHVEKVTFIEVKPVQVMTTVYQEVEV
jgi:hypothetical protein